MRKVRNDELWTEKGRLFSNCNIEYRQDAAHVLFMFNSNRAKIQEVKLEFVLNKKLRTIFSVLR